jgi:hypothetical protein
MRLDKRKMGLEAKHVDWGKSKRKKQKKWKKKKWKKKSGLIVFSNLSGDKCFYR